MTAGPVRLDREIPELPPIVERLLVHAVARVHVLAALTPENGGEERARLTRALETGREATPRWRYGRTDHDGLVGALESAAEALEARGASAVERVAIDRLRELAIEARLCGLAGTAMVGALAARRFWADVEERREADARADAWLREVPPAAVDGMPSDAPSPGSLVSRMRAEVGRRRLPFTVVVQPGLAPLAATGAEVILVAAGRPVSPEDVERTVLHEIEGHAAPRARALKARSALFRVGTARGVDDQEGFALLLEERAGWLGPARRHRLAVRHRAARAMSDGASYHEVARLLVGELDVAPADAVIAADRAFRGSDGARPGLGRERVYLEAYGRVREHLEARPEDERVIRAGQVACGAAGVMRGMATGPR